jgi:hypothetical protein
MSRMGAYVLERQEQARLEEQQARQQRAAKTTNSIKGKSAPVTPIVNTKEKYHGFHSI